MGVFLAAYGTWQRTIYHRIYERGKAGEYSMAGLPGAFLLFGGLYFS